MRDTEASGEFVFFDFEPEQGNMAAEVLAGLAQTQKALSPKYFYDSRGSELFERITELEEYYLTRTEMALFGSYLGDIAELTGRDVCLIEYGSGSSMKIRKLLEAVAPRAYVPIDISLEHLRANAWALHQDYPSLDVYPICADLTQPFELPQETDGLAKVGFFPGSSIGNFEPHQAQQFLQTVHATLGVGANLIIGVDRKKSRSVLEPAYNDQQGVTAEFNLNLLTHLNDKLGANFIVDQFSHDARYNEELGCIQMFLKSRCPQQVELLGECFQFAEDEELHTENSYKYDPHELSELARGAGFQMSAQWSDERDWFSLYLLTAV